MVLQDVVFTVEDAPLPIDIEKLIRVAQSRAARFVGNDQGPASGFVPSDATSVFRTIRELDKLDLLNGNSFCEWGSGFGTATCLAASLGLDAVGFEIDSDLIENARQLADDFALSATFVQGSFIPLDRRSIAEEAFEDNIGRYPWLRNDAEDAYQEIGRGLEDFDVVFAYPWPGEEFFVEQLFSIDAAQGALLLMYDDKSSMSVRRKVSGPGENSFHAKKYVSA